MASYMGVETSTSLLVAYETLAIGFRNMSERENIYSTMIIPGSNPKVPNPYVNFSHCFALLVINASFVEGTLRSILSSAVLEEIDKSTKEGNNRGQTEPDFQEKMMRKFVSDLELSGGWDKLKSAYQTYLGCKFDSRINNRELSESIEILMHLRNIFAHGTSLIMPKEFMAEDESQEYPYTWQNKLHPLQVYLKKHFGEDDIFENLAKYGMPEHFFNQTKEFFLVVENVLAPMPPRVQKTLDGLKSMTFGYVAFTK